MKNQPRPVEIENRSNALTVVSVGDRNICKQLSFDDVLGTFASSQRKNVLRKLLFVDTFALLCINYYKLLILCINYLCIILCINYFNIIIKF